MTISYPITMPTAPKPSRVLWSKKDVVSVSQSPFSLKSETYEFSGGIWMLEVGFDPLYRSEAAPWMAALSSLRGRYGTFLYGDALCDTPLGVATGSPKVAGASQTGFTLATDGWTPSVLVLKAGDLFQIDNSMYQNLVDATANGSGEVTLDIWPALRGHADNATIITSEPKCLMRLVDDPAIIDAPQTALFSIGFTAEEAL